LGSVDRELGDDRPWQISLAADYQVRLCSFSAPPTSNPVLEKAAMIKFLSLAPVGLMALLTFTAGLLIEFNRFFPDLLFHPMP
jgi:photosystem I subunit IX